MIVSITKRDIIRCFIVNLLHTAVLRWKAI